MTSLEISVFFTIVLSIIALGVVIVLLGERIRGAIREGNATIRDVGVQELALLREQVAGERVQVNADNWTDVLAQVMADVSKANVGVEEFWRIGTEPCPHFKVLGSDGRQYTFTTDHRALVEAGLVDKKDSAWPVDALVSPFAVEELHGVWRVLADQSTAVGQTTLPRGGRWWMVASVVEVE
ncbi:MAG TPA: hypothetical protein EYP88_06345 [Anaerolineales bacterium]|nr:hypothetical protein [Anaerolineales bacterium]